MQETQLYSLGQEDPLEKEMAPTPGFLLEKFHGQRSLAGYSPWAQKKKKKKIGHDLATRQQQPKNNYLCAKPHVEL